MEIHGADDMLLSITAAGRMLMFPVADLPQLSKGKGNKIVSIPAARAAAGEDKLAAVRVAAAGVRHAARRQTQADAAAGRSAEVPCGARSQGTQLPRGLQRIDRVEVDAPVRVSGSDSEE